MTCKKIKSIGYSGLDLWRTEQKVKWKKNEMKKTNLKTAINQNEKKNEMNRAKSNGGFQIFKFFFSF